MPLSRRLGNPAEIAHGPVIGGFTVNAVLLGVMTTQVYLYYTSFKKDKTWIKIFVAIIFALDIVNTACDAAYIYEALVIHFGDFNYLGTVTWLFDTDPSVTGVIVTAVQSFFAWRIWVLTKNWFFPALIIATAITGGVTAIVTPAQVAKAPTFVDLIFAKVPIIIWLSSEVLGDILITTILVTYLQGIRQDLSARISSSIESSEVIEFSFLSPAFNNLFGVIVTIQTGLITSIVATTNLIVYLTDKTGLHLLFNYPLAKLYSNSLMSTLNARGIWMQGRSGLSNHGTDEQTISMNNINSYRPPVPPPMKPSGMINLSAPPKHTEVYVNVESEVQDGNNSLRSNLPLGKGAFDDDDKRSYP